jgi:hypothetical protein
LRQQSSSRHLFRKIQTNGTAVDFEFGISADQNIFSIDDANNKGIAGKNKYQAATLFKEMANRCC